MTKLQLIDVHAHITDLQFANDLQQTLERTKSLEAVISAGTSLTSSQAAIKLAKENSHIYATVGIHPEDVSNFFAEFESMEKLLPHEKVVAVGEIGLDYHYLNEIPTQEHENHKKLQKEAFEKQIALANKFNLPIVVHSRDAMADTLEILTKNPPKRASLLHCFSGSLESAKQFMELGFSFSFGGVVTFKNAARVKEVVKGLPLEKILLETDCPYMSPEPFRGTRNEPKNVVYVADAIASLKNLSLEEVARVTSANAKKMFGLK